MSRRPTRSTLFPYTTLFRSQRCQLAGTLRDDGAGDHRADRGAGDALRRRPRHERHLDRKSTRLNSSHLVISYAVFCLEKKSIDTNVTREVETEFLSNLKESR